MVSNLVIAIAFALIGGFIYGYGLTISAGVTTPLLQCTWFGPEDQIDYGLYAGIFSASFFVGNAVGGLFTTLFTRKMNRITALYLNAWLEIIFSLMQSVWGNLWFVTVSRFLFGVIGGITSALNPIHAAEIVEVKHQSMIKATYSASISIAVIWAQLMNLFTPNYDIECVPVPDWSWRLQFGASAILGVFMIIFTWIYSIKVKNEQKQKDIKEVEMQSVENKDEDKKEEISGSTSQTVSNSVETSTPSIPVESTTISDIPNTINSTNPENQVSTESDIQTISEAPQEAASEVPFKQDSVSIDVKENSKKHYSFYSWHNFSLIFYVITIPVMNQLTGINAVVVYAPVVFQKANIQNVLLIQLGLVGAWNCICNWVSVFIVDKMNRKLQVVLSLLIMSLGGLSLSLSFFIDQYILAIVGILLYILGFGLGPSPFFYILLDEVPEEYKNPATSLAVVLRYVTCFVIVFCFSLLMEAFLNFLGGMIYSYNNSIVGGMSKSLVGCTLYEPGEVDVSTFQSILTASILVGATVGAPLGTWACSSLSRKLAAIIVSIIGIIIPLITIAWDNYWYLVVMRLLVGIAMGMSASVFPLYCVEITEMKHKSAVGTLFGVAVGAGVIVAQCMNLFTPKFDKECVPVPSWSWRLQLAFAAIWGVLSLIILFFSPESPIDIEKRKKKTDASSTPSTTPVSVPDNNNSTEKNIETNSTTTPSVTDDNKEIKEQIKSEIDIHDKKDEEIVHSSICHCSNFKWLIYAIILPAFSNITGVYIFIYYAPIIFQAAGIDNVLVIQIGLVGCTMTICSIISSFVVSKVSRLLLLRITAGTLVIGTIIVILSFAIQDNKSLTVPLAVIGTLVFLIGFGLGPASLYYVCLVQDFPPYLKTSAISFANIIRYIMNAILTFCFPIILDRYGPVAAFVILLAIQLIIFIYLLFFFPIKSTKQSIPKPQKVVNTETQSKEIKATSV
ncbi:hypothetical protein WA158_005061 [Blastocystis sp. Blastoise]